MKLAHSTLLIVTAMIMLTGLSACTIVVPLPNTKSITSGTPPATTQPSAKFAVFDGHQRYAQAYRLVLNLIPSTTDPTVRSTWMSTWEHRHDHDGALKTREGTDVAISEMLNSVAAMTNVLFDPNVSALAILELQAGIRTDYIGIRVKLVGCEEMAKKLPSHPNDGQLYLGFTVSPEHPLIVTTVFSHSAAEKAGLLVGDNLIEIDGKPIANQSALFVLSAVPGAADTKLSLTVERHTAGGKLIRVPITVVREQFPPTPVTQPANHHALSKWHEIYAEALQLMLDENLALRDPKAQTNFANKWLHRHDSDGVLDTESGALATITAMLNDLGQLHNHVLEPRGITVYRFQRFVDQLTEYVGINVELVDAIGISRALPPGFPSNEKVSEVFCESPQHALMVSRVLPLSPAGLAGLHQGDRIVAIQGKPIAGKSAISVLNEFAGKDGSTLSLTVERHDQSGKSSELPITIVRKQLSEVTHQDLGDGICYLKINRAGFFFAVPALQHALVELAPQAKALILDLRGDEGTDFTTYQYAIRFLLEQGSVATEVSRSASEDLLQFESNMQIGNSWVVQTNIPATGQSTTMAWSCAPTNILPTTTPIVVLVDHDTRLCAELLAGSLQVNGRAVVVGITTGGNGEGTQSAITNTHHLVMYFAKSEYRVRPNQPIDHIGIKPDVLVQQPADATTDVQLEAAVSKAHELLVP